MVRWRIWWRASSSRRVAAAHVAPAVVCHQPFRLDAVFGVESERALEEADHGGGPLVVVDLGVGEPGVVVDDRVHDVASVAVLAVLAAPVAGHAVSGPLEAHVLARVHVQEVAGAGPLVAVGRLARRPRRPREPGPAEHLPDGRVREASRAGDQARAPARLLAAPADCSLELRRELARRAVRPAGAIEQTRKRRPRLLARPQPAMPPAVRRRRRHTEGGRGRLQRHPLRDGANQRVAAGQSELRVTVKRHPSPPSSVSPGRRTASKEGRIDLSAVHNVCR